METAKSIEPRPDEHGFGKREAPLADRNGAGPLRSGQVPPDPPTSPTTAVGDGLTPGRPKSPTDKTQPVPPFPDNEPDLERIPGTATSIVGHGSFGVVYLARRRSSGKLWAVKALPERAARNETRAWSALAPYRDEWHAHLIPVHRIRTAVETDNDPPPPTYIFMAHAPGGDLHQHLLTHGAWPEPTARRLFTQLVGAVAWLHERGIVHRDIKPDNILLASSTADHIYLADFGLAAPYTPGVPQQSFAGSPHYAAPEVHFRWPYDGPEADVWSIGAVLYTVLAARVPFDGVTVADLRHAVMAANPVIPIHVSPEATQVLRRAFARHPAQRAHTDVLARLPWARGASLTSADRGRARARTVPPPIATARCIATGRAASVSPTRRVLAAVGLVARDETWREGMVGGGGGDVESPSRIDEEGEEEEDELLGGVEKMVDGDRKRVESMPPWVWVVVLCVAVIGLVTLVQWSMEGARTTVM